MRSSLIAVYLGQTSAIVAEHQVPHLVSSSRWKNDCKQRHAVHPSRKVLAQVSKTDNPGAGVDGYDSTEPYTQVYKDGFLKVDCVKDAMYEHGDKFGNNRDGYRMGPIANTSIVHYTEIVPKEDREKMTYSVCFEFCRGIKSMSFFGINNGRDCYCTPYFQAMASDSSNCDSACEGDDSVTCGGKSKSLLFSMHMCQDTDKELAAAQKKGLSVRDKLETLSKTMVDDTEQAQAKADMMQRSLGEAGDPDASSILRESAVWAGKNIAAGKKGKELVEKLNDLETKTSGASGKDLSKYENVNEVEDIVREWGKVTYEAKGLFDDNSEMWDVAQPPINVSNLTDWDKQYYPIMYFVDKKHEAAPSTCTGELVDKPVLNYNPNECAAACDSLVGRCVGFAFFWSKGGVCFLYSKFKTVQYYTGCEDKPPSKEFLQIKQLAVQKKKKAAPFEAQCVAKLQFFEGTSLKPNLKCPTDNCLTEVTEAARCFK